MAVRLMAICIAAVFLISASVSQAGIATDFVPVEKSLIDDRDASRDAARDAARDGARDAMRPGTSPLTRPEPVMEKHYADTGGTWWKVVVGAIVIGLGIAASAASAGATASDSGSSGGTGTVSGSW